MKLTWAFRISSFLTLAFSCIGLAAAEHFFLPGIYWFLLVILLLLASASFTENRWTLPLKASNILGGGIGVGALVWLGIRVYGVSDATLQDVALPAAILPFLGPLLMILLVVKSFRPKTMGDQWSLHGLGLGQVALGCILATEPEFGLVFLAYVACGLWHLVVFHHVRAAENARYPHFSAGEDSDWKAIKAPSLMRSLAATGALLIVSMPIFLVLPRQGQSAWNPFTLVGRPFQRRVETVARTGFANEIDLNRQGPLELDDEVAFSVSVQDAFGSPKLDLSSSQLWRGIVLDRYRDGKWTDGTSIVPSPVMPRQRGRTFNRGDAVNMTIIPHPVSTRDLPDLGPAQYFVDFKIRSERLGGLFLAEPVDTHFEETFEPLQNLAKDTRYPPLFVDFQDIILIGRMPEFFECRYRQVKVDYRETEEYWPRSINFPRAHFFLCNYPAEIHERVHQFTGDLLQKLKAEPEYGLSEVDLQLRQVPRRPRIQMRRNPAKVARALTQYLSSSGDYAYSLDRTRSDPDLDPMLDFLINVKQGPCERFAGALALLLRSQEIPARIVKGFRGAEHQGDGKYDIRNSMAHAWVEAMIAHVGPDERLQYYWLTLDPTPSVSASQTAPFSLKRWLQARGQSGEDYWREFIVNYQADQQRAILANFWQSLTESESASGAGPKSSISRIKFPLVLSGLILFPLGVIGGFVYLWRRRRRSKSGPASRRFPGTAFYARYLRVLATYAHLLPTESQTPQEFAEEAAHKLSAHPRAAPLADMPQRMSALYYRIRYGGHLPSEAETQQIQERLDTLESALIGV